MAGQYQYLSPKENTTLLKLLRKFEDIFDVTLGTWETTLVDLELKDNAKPVCSHNYPIPMLCETMFRKEVKILVNLGVLEEENDSEWGAPSLSQQNPQKKELVKILK